MDHIFYLLRPCIYEELLELDRGIVDLCDDLPLDDFECLGRDDVVFKKRGSETINDPKLDPSTIIRPMSASRVPSEREELIFVIYAEEILHTCRPRSKS